MNEKNELTSEEKKIVIDRLMAIVQSGDHRLALRAIGKVLAIERQNMKAEQEAR